MKLSPSHVNRCLTKSTEKKRQLEVMSKFLKNLKGSEFDSKRQKGEVVVRRVQLFIERNPTASEDALASEIAEGHAELSGILSEMSPRGCTLGEKSGCGFGFWESHTSEDVEADQIRPEKVKERIPHIYKMRAVTTILDKMVTHGFCDPSQYEICRKTGECHRGLTTMTRREDFKDCAVFTVEVLQEN